MQPLPTPVPMELHVAPGTEFRNYLEAAGVYHLEDTRTDMIQRLQQAPIASDRAIQSSRRAPYISALPIGAAMTWTTQAWIFQDHRRCLGGHRFALTKLILADAQILLQECPFLKKLLPTAGIGNIWVSACPLAGTMVNIVILNKVFSYGARVLGNLCEVITCNDVNAFYIAVMVHSPASTDAIVGKFSGLNNEVFGGFKHYVKPGTQRGLDKLKIFSGLTIKGEHIADGGMEVTHVSGSFPNRTPIAMKLLMEVVNSWDHFTTKYGDQVVTYMRFDGDRSRTRKHFLGEKEMKFQGTAEDIYKRYPCGFNLEPNCIDDLERVSKYLSDTPYLPEPFFAPMAQRAEIFTKKVELMVCHYTKYGFFDHQGWGIDNDWGYQYARDHNLHQLYHRTYGIWLAGPEIKERNFGKPFHGTFPYFRALWNFALGRNALTFPVQDKEWKEVRNYQGILPMLNPRGNSNDQRRGSLYYEDGDEGSYDGQSVTSHAGGLFQKRGSQIGFQGQEPLMNQLRAETRLEEVQADEEGGITTMSVPAVVVGRTVTSEEGHGQEGQSSSSQTRWMDPTTRMPSLEGRPPEVVVPSYPAKEDDKAVQKSSSSSTTVKPKNTKVRKVTAIMRQQGQYIIDLMAALEEDDEEEEEEEKSK